MEQLTKEQAIEFHNSRAWEKMTPKERAVFQIEQDLLCMPFSVYHESLEMALGRGVYTHEMGLNRAGLRDELKGVAPAPSLAEIISMLPGDKTIAVVTD